MSSFQKSSREVGARLTHNAAQSLTHNTATILSLNTGRRVNGVTAGSDRLTAAEAGWYVITGHAEFAASATGVRTLVLLLNGTTVIAGQAAPSVGASFGHYLSITSVYYLAVGDFVQLRAFQDSGGALNVNQSANYSPELALMKLPGVP